MLARLKMGPLGNSGYKGAPGYGGLSSPLGVFSPGIITLAGATAPTCETAVVGTAFPMDTAASIRAIVFYSKVSFPLSKSTMQFNEDL